MARIAVVFPGQGSQQIDMLKDFASRVDKPFEFSYQHFMEIARSILGEELYDRCVEGQYGDNDTQVIQPAVFLADVMHYLSWLQSNKDFPPLAVAGHSVGEWAALVAAHVIGFEAALECVKKRSKLMTELGIEDGQMMAIVGPSSETVEKIILHFAQERGVYPAAINEINQLVVAGPAKGIQETLEEVVERLGAKGIILSVSGAFHTPHMAKAAEAFAQYLEEGVTFSAPDIPICLNATGEFESDPVVIKKQVAEAIAKPVQWYNIMDKLDDLNIDQFVESGSGKTLTKMFKRVPRLHKQLSRLAE